MLVRPPTDPNYYSTLRCGQFTQLGRLLTSSFRIVTGRGSKNDFLAKVSSAITSSGTPEVDIREAIGVVDNLITNRPFGAYAVSEQSDFFDSLKTFVNNCRNCIGNPFIVYKLGDGASKIELVAEKKGGEATNEYALEAKFHSLFPITDEAKKLLESISIKPKQATELSMNDIRMAVVKKDIESFIFALSDIDELLCGENQRMGYYQSQDQFNVLTNEAILLLDRAHDLNPYFGRTFKLGDCNSELRINVDTERKQGRVTHLISFELKTNANSVKQRFEVLKEQGLLAPIIYYDSKALDLLQATSNE